MIRKSAWLLSAGLFALATPAFAQTAQSTTDTDKQAARPDRRARPKARRRRIRRASSSRSTPATSSSPRRAATRRCPTFRWRSAPSRREQLRNTGATDIRQLNQVAPSLLVSSTSSEGGAARRAHSRHRHGRRQSRPRRLGRRLHRRRLSLARGRRPHRAWSARSDRGAARAAGHAVRPQHLGGPDLDHHRQAALHAGGRGPDRRRQLRHAPRRGSVTGPLSDTIAARLDGVYLKRDGFLKDVISGRRSTTATAGCYAGQVLFQPNDDLSFRLIGDYSKRNEECCGAALPAGAGLSRRRGRNPRRLPPSSAGSAAIINDDTFSRRSLDHARAATMTRESRTTACRASWCTTSAVPN